jgi:hypothetical protein
MNLIHIITHDLFKNLNHSGNYRYHPL